LFSISIWSIQGYPVRKEAPSGVEIEILRREKIAKKFTGSSYDPNLFEHSNVRQGMEPRGAI